jgi:hypothetical protein
LDSTETRDVSFLLATTKSNPSSRLCVANSNSAENRPAALTLRVGRETLQYPLDEIAVHSGRSSTRADKMPLRSVTNNLWVAEQSVRFLGVALTSRTTVIRMADGALMVHSPVRLDERLLSSVSSVGSVRFILAPNRFHHLFVADWQKAFPEALTFFAPGLDRKRPDLKFNAVLGDAPLPEWRDEIDQTFMRAFPPLNEIVFFHRVSRTLIFTDLLFNISHHDSAYARFLLRLDGAFHGPAVPRSFRLLLRRKRAECRDSIRRVLSWDFGRTIVAHGDIIESNARSAVEHAWRFALSV